MRTIKRIVVLLVLVLVVGAVYVKIHGANAKTLAKVGDSKITTTDVEFFKKFSGELLSDDQILNVLIEKEVLFQEAKKSGILDKAKAEGEKETKKVKENAKDSAINYAKDKADEFLKSAGISENKYWNYVQDYLTKNVAADLEKKKLDKSKIEELKKQYEVKIYN